MGFFYSAIYNADSTLLVCLYGSERMGMTKLVQCGMNGDFLFCIDEECLKLCFCCRYKNMYVDGGVYMVHTIDRWSEG